LLPIGPESLSATSSGFLIDPISSNLGAIIAIASIMHFCSFRYYCKAIDQEVGGWAVLLEKTLHYANFVFSTFSVR
jgi:hypothetical protein